MFLLHPPIAPWITRHDDGCHITLFCDRHEGLTIYLRAEPDNEERLLPMQATGKIGALFRFEADLPWDGGNITTHYVFKVLHDQTQTWLAADGQHRFLPTSDVHFKVCREHQPPAWVKEQVFYQIFPDRFCQGDESLAVKTDEYVYGSGYQRVTKKAWGEPVDQKITAAAFYGGDLPGITQQLDYLQKELGITALYLNPIFTSGSNHRYDTDDYFSVDPHLGGNQALEDLTQALRQRGMKIVLDAVVNHTSYNHPWFNRYARHDSQGAYQSEESPYRNWYTFSPDGAYASWKNHHHLPVLDMANKAVQEQVYDSPNAILRHWLRPPYAINGWRFDVLHMLGEGPGAKNNAFYVREFRRALREENPQAYVMGEHFSEATRWLQGEQEDGAMNYYGFAHPLRAWLANQDIAYQPIQISTPEFEHWLTTARSRVPYDNQLAQLNLIDSHDTVRFLSLVEGDLDKMKLAVTLLLTYPGAPCVYYGDEIGLEGLQDPDCRRCFDWDRNSWNTSLLEHYQTLIRLRTHRPELAQGAYQTLALGGEALVFARYTDSQLTLVAVNRGTDEITLTIPAEQLPFASSTWQGTPLPQQITLAGSSSYIWHGQTN